MWRFKGAWTRLRSCSTKRTSRGLFLEALAAYHAYSLGPLVELLRVVHAPHKIDFGLKDVEQDLPRGVVTELEHFHKTTLLEELAARHRELRERFAGLLKATRLL